MLPRDVRLVVSGWPYPFFVSYKIPLKLLRYLVFFLAWYINRPCFD